MYKKKKIIIILIFCFSILIISLFLSNTLKTFKVTTNSMFPTIKKDDIILVKMYWKLPNKFKHGSVVILKSPVKDAIIIKRIIGIEDDIVEIKNSVIFVNSLIYKDEKKDQKYLDQHQIYYKNELHDLENTKKVVIPKGYCFVLGDNFYNSLDSRDFGPIKVDLIKGEVIGCPLLNYGTDNN